MMHHGLNRDNHAELARWAEAAAARGDTGRGVLVTGDGRLHAETIRPSIIGSISTGTIYLCTLSSERLAFERTRNLLIPISLKVCGRYPPLPGQTHCGPGKLS